MSDELALLFMRAVGYQPIRCVVERRGKVYDLWTNKHSHRKIISRSRLKQMSLVDFVEWLRNRNPQAKALFPDPQVYQDSEGVA